MKNLKHASLVLLSLALLPACAKKSSNNSQPQPVQATPPSIVNDYMGSCEIEDGKGQLTEMNFDASDNLTKTVTFYGDSTCSQPTYAMIVHEHYQLGAQTSVSGVYSLDLAAVDVSLMPFTSGEAKTWNTKHHCNIADWNEGVAKTLNQGNLSCVDGVDTSRTLQTLVQIVDANTIKLGAAADPSKDDGYASRQTTIAAPAYVKKGANVNPLQPTPPDVQPVPVGQCPAFARAYACDSSSGDPSLLGKDLYVTVNGIEFDFAVRRSGVTAPDLSFRAVADGLPHASSAGTQTEQEVSSCASATLSSHSVISDSRNSNYSLTMDRSFRVLANGDLFVGIVSREISDLNHPGPTKGTDTTCHPLQ